MNIKSSSDRYGLVAISLHWLVAIVVLGLIGTGFRASGAELSLTKASLLQIHIPLGITVLLLTVIRICWWLFADKKPEPVTMPNWQARSARLVHILLYVALLGMAASGIGMLALSGAAEIIFGSSSAALPNFHDYLPRIPHGLGARFILALLALHIGAALFHQFIKRDGLINRMWFKKSP